MRGLGLRVIKKRDIDKIYLKEVETGKKVNVMIYTSAYDKYLNLRLRNMEIPNSDIGSSVIDIKKQVDLFGPLSESKIREFCRDVFNLSYCINQINLYY